MAISAHMKLRINCEVSPCQATFARKESYRTHVLQHHSKLNVDRLRNLLQKIKEMKEEDYAVVTENEYEV